VSFISTCSPYLSLTISQSLQDKRVLALDLAAVMAGSGIRGAFEEKFKALVKDIEEEVSSESLFQECFPSLCTGWTSHMFHRRAP
jgi:hypothetical protein